MYDYHRNFMVKSIQLITKNCIQLIHDLTLIKLDLSSDVNIVLSQWSSLTNKRWWKLSGLKRSSVLKKCCKNFSVHILIEISSNWKVLIWKNIIQKCAADTTILQTILFAQLWNHPQQMIWESFSEFIEKWFIETYCLAFKKFNFSL